MYYAQVFSQLIILSFYHINSSMQQTLQATLHFHSYRSHLLSKLRDIHFQGAWQAYFGVSYRTPEKFTRKTRLEASGELPQLVLSIIFFSFIIMYCVNFL